MTDDAHDLLATDTPLPPLRPDFLSVVREQGRRTIRRRRLGAGLAGVLLIVGAVPVVSSLSAGSDTMVLAPVTDMPSPEDPTPADIPTPSAVEGTAEPLSDEVWSAIEASAPDPLVQTPPEMLCTLCGETRYFGTWQATRVPDTTGGGIPGPAPKFAVSGNDDPSAWRDRALEMPLAKLHDREDRRENAADGWAAGSRAVVLDRRPSYYQVIVSIDRPDDRRLTLYFDTQAIEDDAPPAAMHAWAMRVAAELATP